MTVAADSDDKWLRRLIFAVEVTEDNQIHPAAWERFKHDSRVPQWSYVLSGTSWKLGKTAFLANATTYLAARNLTRPDTAQLAYRGLIHQVVGEVRTRSAALALDVHVVEDPHDPSHAILVSGAALKAPDGSVTPEVARQLNDLFKIAIAGSVEEDQVLA